MKRNMVRTTLTVIAIASLYMTTLVLAAQLLLIGEKYFYSVIKFACGFHFTE